ncbi:hypothetical protein BGZ59_010779, partial [Podila verticillata]
MVAELDMKKGRHNIRYLESETLWTAYIAFLNWSAEFVNAPLSDYSASILNCAAGQHPTMLKFFALDVSGLSQTGFSFIQNILRRPSCSISMSSAPLWTQTWLSLNAVNWSTLKSLKLSGDEIDAWIHIWMMAHKNDISPNVGLQSLTICRGSHELSHSSTLFIHHLVYVSSLELHLKVHLQDEHDQRLITDAVA